MPKKEPQPMMSHEDSEKVARHGFGITDEDIAKAKADEKHMAEWNRTKETEPKEATDVSTPEV